MVVTNVVRRNRKIEQLGEAWTLERASGLLLAPRRRFRQERPDDDQGKCWNHPGHQRVAPRIVSPQHHRQRLGVSDDPVVRTCRHDPADRCERLRVSDDRFALFRIGEQLGQPRDGRDELDADADERAATPEQQPSDRGRKAGRQGRDRIQQNAPHEHPAAAEQVGQVAAEQSEDAPCHRGDVEQESDPLIHQRTRGRDVEQFRRAPAARSAAASAAHRNRTRIQERQSRK